MGDIYIACLLLRYALLRYVVAARELDFNHDHLVAMNLTVKIIQGETSHCTHVRHSNHHLPIFFSLSSSVTGIQNKYTVMIVTIIEYCCIYILCSVYLKAGNGKPCYVQSCIVWSKMVVYAFMHCS